MRWYRFLKRVFGHHFQLLESAVDPCLFTRDLGTPNMLTVSVVVGRLDVHFTQLGGAEGV